MKFFIICFLATITTIGSANAGFSKVESKYGWDLWYDSNRNVYLHIVNLRKARIVMECSNYVSDCSNERIGDHWADANRNPYAIVNGTLFEDFGDGKSTQMTFPVASYGGNFIANGVGQNDSQWRGYIRTLQINNGSARVYPYYYPSLISGSYYGGIVGLKPHPDGQKQGRTIIGLYGSGTNKTIAIILNAAWMHEPDAVQILRDLNVAEKDIVILDGSGSSQFKTSNRTFYGCANRFGRCRKDQRAFPQYMMIERR